MLVASASKSEEPCHGRWHTLPLSLRTGIVEHLLLCMCCPFERCAELGGSRKRHLIGPVEMYAVLCARALWSKLMSSQRVTIYVDYAGVLASMVKGSSKDPLWRQLLLCYEQLDSDASILWFRRVPSPSNPRTHRQEEGAASLLVVWSLELRLHVQFPALSSRISLWCGRVFVGDLRIHHRALGNRAANSPFGNVGKTLSRV